MLLWIVVACAIGGIVSVTLAWLLLLRVNTQSLGRLIAFAAGAMLATALLDIFPEAITQSKGNYEPIMITFLASIVVLYLLERAAIWRHSHDTTEASDNHLSAAPWVILLGDGVHNFVDGVLIAAAFLVDPWLGMTTTFAVVAHELPQELGDTVVLLNSGWSRKKALIGNGASSLASVLGGVLGYFALSGMQSALPYVLTVAAASFIYIAMTDLLPMLHRRHRVDGFVTQTSLLVAGIVCVTVIGEILHHHH
jgi:zinc and cadmium transporter